MNRICSFPHPAFAPRVARDEHGAATGGHQRKTSRLHLEREHGVHGEQGRKIEGSKPKIVIVVK
jgi:hypothetical protein